MRPVVADVWLLLRLSHRTRDDDAYETNST